MGYLPLGVGLARRSSTLAFKRASKELTTVLHIHVLQIKTLRSRRASIALRKASRLTIFWQASVVLCLCDLVGRTEEGEEVLSPQVTGQPELSGGYNRNDIPD
jgi:hypothetical protein